jgi:hypothetical protein
MSNAMTIRFACTCGHRFDLPADQAGAELQCPTCFRLVDVPRLNELGAFEEDGTLKMEGAWTAPPALDAKVRAFTHREDLRTDLDTFLDIGVPAPDPAQARPRYDPVTGELLRPIGLTADDQPPAAAIPVARPVLSYGSAAAETATNDLKWRNWPWQLLRARSLLAISFIITAHLGASVFLLVPAANLMLLPFVALLAAVVIAHYGNVIDSVGVQKHDHVPVLLRSASFTDDVWLPFMGFLGAVLVSFGPLFLYRTLVPEEWRAAQPWAAYSLLAFGAAIFPAALLTAVASGAVENLLPTRVLTVIRVAPVRYVLALAAFLVGVLAYVVFVRTLSFSTPAVLTSGLGFSPVLALVMVAIQAVSATVATYCMHLSAGWLALIYRSDHERFSWVLQRHTRRPRDDTLARLQELRRNGDPRVRRVKSRTVDRPAATPVLPVQAVEALPPRSTKPTLDYPSSS